MGFFWNTGNDRNANAGLVDLTSTVFACSRSGSVDWSRTLAAARLAAGRGTRRAVVVVEHERFAAVRRSLPRFKALLTQNGIDLEVKLAVHADLRSDLFDRIAQVSAEVGGLNRRLVWLRVPEHNRLPIAPVVEAIGRMNMQTIVVGAERCAAFRDQCAAGRGSTGPWQEIERAGGWIQFSALSLVDPDQPAIRKFARQAIRRGRCHFVASHVDVSLDHAYRQIKTWAGTAAAGKLCRDHPGRLFDEDANFSPISQDGRVPGRARMFLSQSIVPPSLVPQSLVPQSLLPLDGGM